MPDTKARGVPDLRYVKLMGYEGKVSKFLTGKFFLLIK
jgi:hypothetical protein